MNKKHEQLGMPIGTAANRLVKTLLYQFAVAAGHKCFRCGGDLTRENFSIEHKVPWLDSDDPRGLYFDLANIAYSHTSCNVAAARKPRQKYFTPEERLAALRESNRRRTRERYTTEKRRDKYARTGW